MTELTAFDLDRIGPGIEGHALFPEPHQRLLYIAATSGRRIGSVRGSSSAGVGETLSSGTGATGAAVAYSGTAAAAPEPAAGDGCARRR